MPWKCPVCGALNDDDAEFCANCGAPRPREAEGPSVPREQGEAANPPSEAEEAPGAGSEGERPAEQPPAGEAGEAAGEPAVEEASGQGEAEAAPAAEEAGSGGEEAAAPENIYIEIVDTPAHELLGKKVPLMFNVFPRITIGRSPESVIVIPDPTVSRHHAVIERRDGRLVLRDLGSTNGTYVYDPDTGVFKRVEEVELRPGMLLRLGESTIIRIVAE